MTAKDMFSHRVSILTGHYGTGKTEVSVNLALALAAEGEQVMLADLDIVNPYFRSRERRPLLEKAGVRVISSSQACSDADVPALPAELLTILENREIRGILDIGGGTSDIAVLSLNGIVCKNSIKLAGDKFNAAIIRYVRSKYNVLIGERMAERVKIAIASVDPDAENLTYEIKGRHLATGLPTRVELSRSELYPVMLELVEEIRAAVHSVVERTPPELVGDIYENGMVMTGGGAMLHGLDKHMSAKLKMPVGLAENPVECVAIGTGRSFEYIGRLVDGFITSSPHKN